MASWKERWGVNVFAGLVLILWLGGIATFIRMILIGGVPRRDAVWFAILIATIFAGGYARYLWLSRTEGRRIDRILVAFWIALYFVVLAITGYVYTVVDNGPSWVRSAPATWIGLLGVCLAGGALFGFRLWARTMYGLSELIFAIVLAWHLLPSRPVAQISGADIQFAGLMTGCVYLMVRGLDNIHQGIKTDRIVQWVRKRLGLDPIADATPAP